MSNAGDFQNLVKSACFFLKENFELISWRLKHDNEGFTYKPRHEKANILVSNTNQAVQLQKMARSLKFWI